MTPAEARMLALFIDTLKAQGAVLARIHEAQGRTLALCEEILKRAEAAIAEAQGAPTGDRP